MKLDSKNYAAQRAKVLKVVADKAYRPVKPKALAGLMGVPRQERGEFNNVITRMVRDGDISAGGNGCIGLPKSLGLYAGTLCATRHGYAFVVLEDAELSARMGDIFVPAGGLGAAAHKDSVLCKVTTADGSGRRAEGVIVRVVKKGYDSVAGVMRGGMFVPQDTRFGGRLEVAAADARGALDGDMVMASVSPRRAVVREVLGRADAPGVDVLAIVRMHGIPHEWNDETLAEAAAVSSVMDEADARGRVDLRGSRTITIDGEDTKDVDDAVTLERLGDGSFRLGVHIADVAHYVRRGCAIDRTARERGTSVYLADRVIPMLPPVLSNGICSLNAGTDRLALSCIMDIDGSGKVVAHTIAESVIHIDRAISYGVVDDILTHGEDCAATAQYAEFVPMLREMAELAGVLRRKRLARGSIEFGFPEAKIALDAQGRPTSITARVRSAATGIIEECMIAANETVAEEYAWRDVPFVYRTHEEPNEEDIRGLNDFLRGFGHSIKTSKGRGQDAPRTVSPRAVSNLLGKAADTPEHPLISRMVLRSMRQARYTAENIGHFGLASKFYTHFTSPIRRYPDLTIHRAIKATLGGKQARGGRGLEKLCADCSASERRAEACERDVAALKKAQYMLDKVGQTFDGIISGVTKHGIYVELANTVEGMISAMLLPQGYVFVPERLCYSSRGGRDYAMGGAITIEVASVEIEDTPRINFALGEHSRANEIY